MTHKQKLSKIIWKIAIKHDKDKTKDIIKCIKKQSKDYGISVEEICDFLLDESQT